MKDLPAFCILLFTVVTAFAQNYSTYGLYNNNLTAVFPGQPEMMTVKPFTFYLYVDKKNKMSFNAQSQPYPFTNEISEYNQKSVDKTMINGLKASGVEILSFSSHMEKEKNKYTYIAHIRDALDGTVMYRSIKLMILGKDLFRWSVSYTNPKQQIIFNTHQSSVKITN